MKSVIRNRSICRCILLSIALWALLGVSKWIMGSALSDGATILLALVGGIPVIFGLVAAGRRRANRTSAHAGQDGSDRDAAPSSACWSHATSWPLGIPAAESGRQSPSSAVAAGTSPGQRAPGAGRGFPSAGTRGARTVRFVCGTCHMQREMDDLAAVGGTGMVICLACHTREAGLDREMPASLVQAIRDILEDGSKS
jgi:hypothetical protein